MQDILEKPLDFMRCVASRFSCPNYRLSVVMRTLLNVTVYVYRLSVVVLIREIPLKH